MEHLQTPHLKKKQTLAIVMLLFRTHSIMLTAFLECLVWLPKSYCGSRILGIVIEPYHS